MQFWLRTFIIKNDFAFEIKLSFGGNALNEASVLAKLGLQVKLLTVIGEDTAGRMVRERCQELGISAEEVQCRRKVDTGINVVLIQKDGSREMADAF